MSRPGRPALVCCAALLASCGADRAPYSGQFGGYGNGTGGTGGSSEAGLIVTTPPPPPPADAGGLCGNVIVPLVLERPNLYFVLDASGSMSESMDPASAVGGIIPSRYTAARNAIASVLRSVGHRVSYGLALFPLDDPAQLGTDSCKPGDEAFATRPGDPSTFALKKSDGPVLTSLLDTLDRHKPTGLTPTAGTISHLKETLFGLQGPTYAFLLTDGAPNCNVTPCGVEACTVNIQGGCPKTVNCCDPTNGVSDARWCLDEEPTVAAVEALAAGGVKTFVVGMPGTDLYGALLDRLAIAGGTARESSPTKYYPVSSADELSGTLKQIGLSVAISCDVKLKEVPPDSGSVRVYFDQTMLDKTSWEWLSDDTVRVLGESCDHLKAGDVIQVQVVANCPSETM